MSEDPFANTTTVKNIIQHIISPKIVRDGTNGYVSKTDLVNVHNIIFAPGASNEDGTVQNPFTTQYGKTATRSRETNVYHSQVTVNSIIIASVVGVISNSILQGVEARNGYFVILASSAVNLIEVGWFIAKF